MKQTVIQWLTVWTLALSVLCASTQAQNGVTNSTKNPLQIAILHWYSANRTTQFNLSASPVAVAFDGANIWVATNINVTKLKANDGTILGTFLPGEADGVAFDGANIWGD